ncbi:MAG TPA: radical SAM protein, partial [Gammaproteobacteria bacterium]|nr:radical SAM protein [Gammaproteobacteria bacterium]
DHCRGRVLAPMIPARDPEAFFEAAAAAAGRGAGGLLVTGGSNLDDEVEYGPFLPAFRRVKARFPGLRLAVHTGLMDEAGATALAESGIDIAMVDLVGARDTVRQVYHLKREPEDFEHTLAALQATGLRVVPHIVVGLHYGHLLGEWRALEMLQRRRPESAVLVVAMPHYAPTHRPFRVPEAEEVAAFLLDARTALPDTDLLLGCARPPGANRARLDAYAVMAGLDGIVQPAEGVVELAERLGRPVRVEASCCAAPAEVAAATPRRAGCG